jgi:nucleotide-binding universal stress UspA family protein
MSAERLIVVGIDGSTGGRRALAWALGHAAKTGATVEVVTAFAGSEPPLSEYAGSERHHADARQQDDIAAVAMDLDATPTVARTVIAGEPVAVLTDAARTADMLVVGSHGKSHLRTALLGSVSEGCIRAATCPVVVVPAAKAAPRQRQAAATVQKI